MGFKSVRNRAIKAIALFSVTVVFAGFAGAYIHPENVSASGDLYDTLYILRIFRLNA